MAYLAPHYDHDIFMSYAHGAAGRLADSPLSRWSQAFIDRLEADIKSTRVEFDALEIFDDRSADRTASLTDQLKYAVERSALLLIVMSPRYLKSAWCLDEREWFAAQFGERRKGPGRVFVVRAVSTSRQSWPDFLKDHRGHSDLGFQFHAETTEEGQTPFGWPDLVDRNEQFYEQLGKLRTTLIQRLLQLRQSLETPQRLDRTAARAPPKERPRLYLHDPTAGDARSVVANELRQAGCIVIDPAPAAANDTIADSHTESLQRIRLAKRCDAMTVLRASLDSRFEAEIEDIAFDELERINAERETPLPCAVLDRTGEEYELDPIIRRKGVRRFDITVGHWPTAILDWVNSQRAQAA